jgi:hypothetical protein
MEVGRSAKKFKLQNLRNGDSTVRFYEHLTITYNTDTNLRGNRWSSCCEVLLESGLSEVRVSEIVTA